jgi:hypothetical protein
MFEKINRKQEQSFSSILFPAEFNSSIPGDTIKALSAIYLLN